MGFRLGLVYFCFLAFLSLVAFRLAQLQVFGSSQLDRLASKQFNPSGSTPLTYRLPILDRNGKELAVSMRAASIFAHPRRIKQKSYTARILAKELGGTPNYWKKKLSSKKPFIWIRRQVDAKNGKRIAKRKLKGIYVRGENTRVYPNGSLAAQVLGFTDIDGNGISGIEFAQNKALTHIQNRNSILKDGKGKATYIAERLRYPKENDGLYLTIDSRVQYMVEEELRAALESTKAKNAMALVMDPYTGEILAMGQTPSFDPNNARKAANTLFANRLISRRYEPGSTLKAILAAYALDQNILKPNSVVEGHNGKLRMGRKVFTEAEASHSFKQLTVAETIRYSSNIGAIEIAQKMGAQKVKAALDKFGFSQKTKIGLGGEISGSLRGNGKWSPIVLANISFGQGVAFTPLQMIASFAPLANGGYYVRPKILRPAVDAVSRNNLDVRRVLSPKASNQMRSILVSVTEHEKGTGRSARVKGMKVGGKTGTAQKYEAGTGYRGGKYYSSFIGFLPADRPQLLIGVMVDEPQGLYYGSQVAAPVFRRIARKAIHILDRSPKQVATSRPLVQRVLPKRISSTKQIGNSLKKSLMPELRGFSMREALRTLSGTYSNLKVNGNGFLVSQTPKAGKPIRENTAIRLEFSSKPGTAEEVFLFDGKSKRKSSKRS